MKKLALLAGLVGIFAVNALATGATASATANVTVTIDKYIAIHLSNQSPSTTQDNTSFADRSITSGNVSFTVDSNFTWDVTSAVFADAHFAAGSLPVNIAPGAGIATNVPFTATYFHSEGAGGSTQTSAVTITVTTH